MHHVREGNLHFLVDVARIGVVTEDATNRFKEKWCLINDTKAVHEFLHGECGNGNHTKTSVLDFGKLHTLLSSFVFWI